ncbi:hypothetical protein DY000_02033912 [Brassica cretica]|uniref:Uncharacterized protein n=1 Tax=Brassica cretica TaxID=69181 RepID=A0ABQ7DTK6_BRACR|nr:hypothetical protein DY000_02033912 [Brassica cretica]
MFPHLVAAFIAACISVTLSFTMFITPGLDIVLLRCKCAVLVSWRFGLFYPELCGSSPA